MMTCVFTLNKQKKIQQNHHIIRGKFGCELLEFVKQINKTNKNIGRLAV